MKKSKNKTHTQHKIKNKKYKSTKALYMAKNIILRYLKLKIEGNKNKINQ